MNVRTHWLGGLAAGVLAAPVMAAPDHWIAFAAVAAVAAPLPDLDHPGSTYGRFVPLPGIVRVHGQVKPYIGGPYGNAAQSGGQVGRRTPFGLTWHRGGMHSLVAGVVAAGLLGLLTSRLWPAWGWTVALAVAVGFASHLALDSLNQMGQAWLWPVSRKRWRLPWPRIQVGSAGEWLVSGGLIVLLIWAARHLGPATLGLRALGHG